MELELENPIKKENIFQNLLKMLGGDFVIWVLVIVLSLSSILIIYSSTETLAYKEQNGNTEFYLLKHVGLMFLGLGMMFFAHRINYKVYAKISPLMYWVSIPLLLITYLFGSNINEAHRWLTVPGIGISFQTSDFAKLALVMFLARLLSKKQMIIEDFKKGVLPILCYIIGIFILIAPANLSTAMLLFGVCMMVMYLGRVKVKHLLLIIGGGLALLIVLIGGAFLVQKATGSKIARVSVWVSRIENFGSSDKDEQSYQNKQANIAIANGGWIGRGPGNSMQKNFLPNPYADFVFAIIIEEYGILGAVVVMLFYLLLLHRSFRIVIKSPKAFGALLAVGLTMLLVVQAFVNMGVAVHLFPVTGLPLPLISMGGTSFWFTSISIGIILSVSRDIQENENLETV